MIQSIGIDHVVTLDAHTPQIEGFFRIPIDNLSILPIMGRVERDVESGAANGVRGTPSVFINGERYRGPRDVASLRQAIASAPAN